MAFGKSIRLHLVDGTRRGLTVAEIINWTGHVIQAPRSDLGKLLERSEAARTGVYILTGDDPENPERVLAYIGESDVIGQRLLQHKRPENSGGKDFWDKVTVITSKDDNLTKGHARYLESKLVGTALRAGRAAMLNQNSPSPVSLPEADTADMDFFLEQIKIILPVLGLDLLREVVVSAFVESSATETSTRRSPIFKLKSARAGIQAKAQEIDGEFIVLAGSQAKPSWSNTHHPGYEALHRSLIESGKLIAGSAGSDMRVFTENTPFRSPSAASAVIFGRNDNGRLSWVTETDEKTYAQWQDDLIPQNSEADAAIERG